MTLAVRDPAQAAEWCRRERAAGRTLGFVPTMGALHAGHLGLVGASARREDRTVVSVFVNPLQFDDPADFERYPRDFDADAARLSGAGCDLVFTGELAQFFPGPGAVPLRDPGPAAAGLEGDVRPGHFAGVATIVARLFEIVGPTRAYFGEKDFQQTLVVRDLVRALAASPEGAAPQILVLPTVREADGLARSSRNERLSPEERRRAAALPRALASAQRAWSEGLRGSDAIAALVREELRRAGLGGEEGAAGLEYAEVRDERDFVAGPLAGSASGARLFVAVRVGSVRLIDNLALGAPLPAELAALAGRPAER